MFRLEARGTDESDTLYAGLVDELESVRARIDDLRSSEQAKWLDVRELAKVTRETPTRLISTGYKVLDDAQCYLEAGHVMAVLASPSVGKTAVAINMVDRIVDVQPEHNILFSSLEMPVGRLFCRLLGTI